jgi:hypothetical protein
LKPEKSLMYKNPERLQCIFKYAYEILMPDS